MWYKTNLFILTDFTDVHLPFDLSIKCTQKIVCPNTEIFRDFFGKFLKETWFIYSFCQFNWFKVFIKCCQFYCS
jgi:hypothetical protein